MLNNIKPLALPARDKPDKDKDSSLIVYTVTVAIAIALLVWVVTPSSGTQCDIESKGLKIFASIALTTSVILTFLSIEFLLEITSIYIEPGNWDGCKFKASLIFYNLSVISIMLSTLSILLNYLLSTSLFITKDLWEIFYWAAFFSILKLLYDIIYVILAPCPNRTTEENNKTHLSFEGTAIDERNKIRLTLKGTAVNTISKREKK